MKRILSIILIFISISAFSADTLRVKQPIRYYKDVKFDVPIDIPRGTSASNAVQKSYVDSIKSDTIQISRYISGAAGSLAKFGDGDSVVISVPNGVHDQFLSITNNSITWSYQDDEDIPILNLIGAKIVMRPLLGKLWSVTPISLQDNSAYYNVSYLAKPDTFRYVRYEVTTLGSFTADNYNGVSIFKWSGTQWEVVAQTANDPTMWNSELNAMKKVALASEYVASPGLYMIGLHYNCSGTATTTPALRASAASANSITGGLTTTKISRYIAGTSSIPSTIAESSGTVLSYIPMIFITK